MRLTCQNTMATDTVANDICLVISINELKHMIKRIEEKRRDCAGDQRTGAFYTHLNIIDGEALIDSYELVHANRQVCPFPSQYSFSLADIKEG